MAVFGEDHGGVTLKALNAEHGIIQLDNPIVHSRLETRLSSGCMTPIPLSVITGRSSVPQDLVEEVFRVEG